MTSWDLEPQQINGVLQYTATSAEGLVKALEALGGQVKSAAESAGTITPGGFECGEEMGPVGAALGNFMEYHQRALLWVGSRTGHAIEGAGKATVAYIHGDLEQAAQAQRNALKTPEVDKMMTQGGANPAQGRGYPGSAK